MTILIMMRLRNPLERWSELNYLENFEGKYARKHIGDKGIKECVLMDNPVPGNVDKPPAVDIHIKELIKETVTGNRTLSVDGIFFLC